MGRVLHLLSSVEIGGKERAALRLARQALSEGYATSLLLFDAPYRSDARDFDPSPLPWLFMPRGRGLDFRFLKALADLYTEQEIDVVHAHNDSAHVYASLAKRLVFRRKPLVVTTLHTRPHHGGGLARLLMRNVGGSHVYAVAQELADRVVADGWLRSCGTILNGIDAADFSPMGPVWDLRAEFSIPKNHIVFGHIARFDPIKRHDDLLAAMHLLEAKGLPVTVICVGQGVGLPSIRQQAVALPNVRIIETVQDIATFLRSIDGIVLCSEHEATPLSLLEAMACAKPIVATAVGGVPALLGQDTTGCAGILVPPHNPNQLADAIEKVASASVLRQELARKAYRRSTAFTFAREWACYRQIYGRALD